MLPLSTPIPPDHPRLGELIANVGSQTKPVRAKLAKSAGQLSECYWNVADRVAAGGGEMCIGWNLRMWPGLYLCAEHHAVLKLPNGKLLDVTPPHGSNGGAEHALFLPDDRLPIRVDRQPNIRSHYLALSKDPEIAKFIDSYQQFHAALVALHTFYDIHDFHPTPRQPGGPFTVSPEDEDAFQSLVREYQAAQQRMFEARDRLAMKRR